MTSDLTLKRVRSSGTALLLLAVVRVLAGCLSDGVGTTEVQLTPSCVQRLEQGQPIPISASVFPDAQKQGVNWSLSGAGTLSGETDTSVVYQAPTDTTMPTNVRVTATAKADPSKTASLALLLVGPLQISTTSGHLAGRSAGEPIEPVYLKAEGGVPPYAWSIPEGSLPPGLSLSATGTIAGIATSSGTSSFTVQVKDADNYAAKAELKMVVGNRSIVARKRGRAGTPTGDSGAGGEPAAGAAKR
jgi:hypothetical protein